MKFAGGMKQYSTNRTFTVSLRNQLSDVILEQCNVTTKPTLKPQSKAVATAPKTLTQFINAAWIESKKDFHGSKQSINADDIVMAKMRTFSAWPGRIVSFSKDKKRANIHFFGTHDVGSVDVKEIIPFDRCQNVIKLLLLRQANLFHKGILEIEAIFNVPAEKSLLNECQSLL